MIGGDESMVIDWNKFGSKFIRLKEGEKKKIVATGWRQREKTFGTNPPKMVLEIDVLVEDDVKLDVPRTLEVSSFDFVQKLRPLIEKAELAGSPTVKFSVVRWGIGTATKYSVEEL